MIACTTSMSSERSIANLLLLNTPYHSTVLLPVLGHGRLAGRSDYRMLKSVDIEMLEYIPWKVYCTFFLPSEHSQGPLTPEDSLISE